MAPRRDGRSGALTLVGDIGGTHARFALASPDPPLLRRVRRMRGADYPTAAAAIEAYLERERPGELAAACFAVAGPVVDGRVRLTNAAWQLDAEDLARRLGLSAVRLLNDFEAVALSLPFLGDREVRPLGPAAPGIDAAADFTVGVLGPGTGLGVAGLLGRAGTLYPVVGEGGHVGFAPQTTRQIEVLQVLRERFERVSAERLLSGPGLVNIHAALTAAHGGTGAATDAAEVFRQAQAGDDRIAGEAVALFFEALGQAAGDLALQLGAFDGIYLAGGIVRRYPALLGASGFRAAFENKGRHRSLMERVPTWLVTHPEPGLVGAARAVGRRSGSGGPDRPAAA